MKYVRIYSETNLQSIFGQIVIDMWVLYNGDGSVTSVALKLILNRL